MYMIGQANYRANRAYNYHSTTILCVTWIVWTQMACRRGLQTALSQLDQGPRYLSETSRIGLACRSRCSVQHQSVWLHGMDEYLQTTCSTPTFQPPANPTDNIVDINTIKQNSVTSITIICLYIYKKNCFCKLYNIHCSKIVMSIILKLYIIG